MKSILSYYYNIIISEQDIINNECFSYNNQYFCLYEYKRSPDEIDALLYLNELMITNKYSINIIIKNIFDNAITYHNNKNYVLIKINYKYCNQANIKFIPAFYNSEFNILKRNDWGKLWSIKIDYIEYQLTHLDKHYPIINSTINYYIGLAENAISYFNMLDLTHVGLYISHRRINTNNMYNPLELIIDYKVRDIGEYIKSAFFNKVMTIIEIKEYIDTLSLDKIDYYLLYTRMLFPSYYFDLYEKIINDNINESELNNVITQASSYEELLYELYNELEKKVNIIGIEWINKKFL